MWGGAAGTARRARRDRWCRDYRALASRHRDADGVPPQHCFFYPEEEYVEEHLSKIAALCADGFGALEIPLHHDNYYDANFRAPMSRFCSLLHERHCALPPDPHTGRLPLAYLPRTVSPFHACVVCPSCCTPND